MRPFPLTLGLVVIALPFVFREPWNAAAVNDLVSGGLLVGLSLHAGRRWPVRAAQALLGVWIAVGPFLLDGGDCLLYAGVILGKLIALTPLVPPSLFEPEAAK